MLFLYLSSFQLAKKNIKQHFLILISCRTHRTSRWISKGIRKRRNQTLLRVFNQEDAETYAFEICPKRYRDASPVTHPNAMGNAIPCTQRIAEFITTDYIMHNNGLKHYDLI